MELIAVLVSKTKEESGTSTNGNAWKRKTAIFQTIGDQRYQKTVAVSCLNQMCDTIDSYQVGNLLKVQVEADSHEYEGKWFTELRAWQIKPAYTIPGVTDTTNESGSSQSEAAMPSTTEKALDENGNVVG